MTLTPIVIYACEYMRADPTPFLLAEFMAANVWSAGLYISNATNIIIAESERITFTVFAKWCGLPTIVAGVSLYCLLVLWFRKRITSGAIDPDADTDASLLKNPRSAAVGTAILLATIVMLIVFSFVSVPTYIATLTCALAMLLKDIIVDLALLRRGRPADRLNAAATRVYVGGEIEDYYDARSDNEETEEQRRMRMSSRVFSFRMSEDDFPEDFDSADNPTSDDGYFPEYSVVPLSVLQPEWGSYAGAQAADRHRSDGAPAVDARALPPLHVCARREPHLSRLDASHSRHRRAAARQHSVGGLLRRAVHHCLHQHHEWPADGDFVCPHHDIAVLCRCRAPVDVYHCPAYCHCRPRAP
jgi:hypothetical protein